jgi:hypothetical protein
LQVPRKLGKRRRQVQEIAVGNLDFGTEEILIAGRKIGGVK